MIPTLAEAIAERGYETLTPVQEAVTAPEADGRDLLVSAQTGSGKTVGFGLAIGPTLLDDAGRFGPAAAPLALVVAPTRELAMQVMAELRWLYGKTGAAVASCVGGMDVRQERRSLERGAHIVVGTPGRLCDHIRRGALDLSDIRAVVLDEADEMLDLGFREDLEFILQEAPEERRTLLFSATVAPAIARLAETFQRDAMRINTISKAEQHADIAYKALRVAPADADHAIFNLLRFFDDESAIVFANTRAAVSHLSARLSNRGLPVVSLSGELSQTERSHALQAMRDGRARVCVATDVAARGIDLPNLSLVIHADLPVNTESLLHRSGRTGRAGRKGVSALIVTPRIARKAERLLDWAKINAEWTEPPSADEIIRRDEEKLLTDPSWDVPIEDDEADFAARLLKKHGAQAVAAALVRMHRERHAAPEDLQDPNAPAPKRERESFGPSRWFALSVGRADDAEPRWLLPLLLRAADLDKSAIGAIRVQDRETFVEIAEAAAPRFERAIGPDGEIAEGMQARALSEAPRIERGPRRAPGGDRGDRGDRPRRPRREDREEAPREERREPRADSAPAADAWSPVERDDRARPQRADAPRDADGPKAPRKPRKVSGFEGPGKPKTGAKPGPKRGKPSGDDRPAPKRPRRDDGPRAGGEPPKRRG